MSKYNPERTNIGNGAMNSKGSIVTKDVPPYSIEVGNPARILKLRLNDETIFALEETEWWEYYKDELFSMKDSLKKQFKRF